jgi:hypothetical protein
MPWHLGTETRKKLNADPQCTISRAAARRPFGVVVIGAGPAGAIAATTLMLELPALRVLLLETRGVLRPPPWRLVTSLRALRREAGGSSHVCSAGAIYFPARRARHRCAVASYVPPRPRALNASGSSSRSSTYRPGGATWRSSLYITGVYILKFRPQAKSAVSRYRAAV